MDNWYEKNVLDVLEIKDGVYCYRRENKGIDTNFDSSIGLGNVQYFISINKIEAPVPRTFFLNLLSEAKNKFRVFEFKILDENFQTRTFYSEKEILN